MSEAVPVRVVVVDDHPLVRERLVELIAREPDLEVVGEAESRQEAMETIRQTGPELVIVDLALKQSLGMELIRDLRAENEGVKILVVSMQDEVIYAERCLRAGAQGYITKQQASRHVMAAIRTVLNGHLYVSEEVSREWMARSLGRAGGRKDGVVELLADRELQVFELIGRGQSTRQIANLLSVDVKTVETYRGRIREKLSLRDSSEMLQRAIAWVHERPKEG